MKKIRNYLYSAVFVLLFADAGSTDILIFNDFNDGEVNRNNLGYVASYFANNQAECNLFPENDMALTFDKFGYSLRLDYNIMPAKSFAGYWSKVKNYDLRKYNYISFWIRGKTGLEIAGLQIKAENSFEDFKKSEVIINNYIPGGLSTDWRKAVIPLDAFANIKDWSRIDELIIIFNNENNVLYKSSVYIDNIIFGDTFLKDMCIDNYNDNFAQICIGGQTGVSFSAGELSYSISREEYISAPSSLKLEYNLTALNSFVYYYMVLGGGTDGWLKFDHDYSKYDTLSFWAKALSQNLNPCGIKIEIHDFSGLGIGEPFYKITKNAVRHISTNWQKFEIPLSDFADFDGITLNKHKVQEIVFTLENSNVSNKEGIVYIDDLSMTASQYSNISRIPAVPYDLKDNKNDISDGHYFTYTSKIFVRADSVHSCPGLESIRFEYSSDNLTWHIFKRDFDIKDHDYKADLDLNNFSETKTNYSLRIGAENIYGHTSYLGPIHSLQFKKFNYQDDRAGKLISSLSVVNNPFTPADQDADFHFILDKRAEVSLLVMDLSGRILWESAKKELAAGEHSILWNGKNDQDNVVPGGLYFYKLKAKSKNNINDEILQIIGVVK